MPFHIRPFLNLSLAFYLLITLLVLSTAPADAEWVKVVTLDDGAIYVDSDTVRRKGDQVKWWELSDRTTTERTVAGISYLSSKSQVEYDCAEERIRLLALTVFSGNMGGGKAVWSNSNEEKWQPVQPDSVGQFLWKYACDKK